MSDTGREVLGACKPMVTRIPVGRVVARRPPSATMRSDRSVASLLIYAARKGFWPKRIAGASNANATVAERDADLGGGAVFHDTRVEVALSSRV